MSQYVNASGIARRVLKRYERVEGVARRVLKAYANASGVARQYFWENYSPRFQVLGTDNPDRTLHDSFAGADGSAWRFYLDSTGFEGAGGDPHRAVVTLTGELGGKTVTVTARRTANEIDEDDRVDCAKVTWWREGENPTASLMFTSEEDTTKTVTLPDDVVALRVGVWLASVGRAQIEMIVTQLEIDGEPVI